MFKCTKNNSDYTQISIGVDEVDENVKVTEATKTIAKYDNDMNRVNLKGFTKVDMDLFFAICAQVAEHGTEEMTFSFSDMMKLINYENGGFDRFGNDLIRMRKKLQSIGYRGEIPGYEDAILLFFPTFAISKKRGLFTVGVNSNKFVLNLLNEIHKHFTILDLETFGMLNSKYAKELYRQLRQWRSTGSHYFDVNELPEILGASANYSVSEFTRRVLNPAVKELTNARAFTNLSLTLDREKGRGRRIKRYIFTWEKEQDDEWYKWLKDLTGLKDQQVRYILKEARKYSRDQEYIAKCWKLSNRKGTRDVVAMMRSFMKNEPDEPTPGKEVARPKVNPNNKFLNVPRTNNDYEGYADKEEMYKVIHGFDDDDKESADKKDDKQTLEITQETMMFDESGELTGMKQEPMESYEKETITSE